MDAAVLIAPRTGAHFMQKNKRTPAKDCDRVKQGRDHVNMKRNYSFPKMTITKFDLPLSCSQLPAASLVVYDDGIGKIAPPTRNAAVNQRVAVVTDIVKMQGGN